MKWLDDMSDIIAVHYRGTNAIAAGVEVDGLHG